MNLFKDIVLWWFLIYSILVITIKPIRENHIDFLKRIDNWKYERFDFFRKDRYKYGKDYTN